MTNVVAKYDRSRDGLVLQKRRIEPTGDVVVRHSFFLAIKNTRGKPDAPVAVVEQGQKSEATMGYSPASAQRLLFSTFNLKRRTVAD